MWNHGTGGYASPETGSCSGFFRRAEILYPANLNSRWRGDSSWYCHHNPDERNPAWYLKQGSQGNDRKYILCAAGIMLDDISGVSKIFLITGRTDMRKSFDGLMAIIRNIYQLDPYANAVYLFCGRDSRKIKALYFDKTGFVLMQKRLDGIGRFQWPRNASEARLLSRQEFRWLMEGLSIDQPKAIRVSGRKKDF